MPMLLLKVSSLAFIKLMVNIITAELDWIIHVDINPVIKLFVVEDVRFNNFCFVLFNDKDIRLLLKQSIEYIKSVTPPINKVNVIFITL